MVRFVWYRTQELLPCHHLVSRGCDNGARQAIRDQLKRPKPVRDDQWLVDVLGDVSESGAEMIEGFVASQRL